MTAEIRQLETTPGPAHVAAPQLRTLVVCDIADSTALVERMGDQSAANIIRKHDRLARALVERHQGREIDKTDGFLLLFERPIQAAAFALDYQRALKHMSAAEGVVVRARVGIHMGDVVIWENAAEDVARGAKPIEVEGLVKPIAARLAQLARPQQILMSFAAAGIAHRAEGELGRDAAARVRWKDHGRYSFKGLPDPLEVIEVGEDDVAPLHAPKSVRTAKKILPWWRRPLTLAAEAAVLAIGVGVGTWMVLQSPPTLAFGARDWVVVGDLHNLTGDKVFDQSVDSALRISLEQSQYVNVLPQLSVQQTLQRMELNPAKADVNRSVGSQVALRDGARALILPTVADVDGRISVTAEVVDPNTEATVYSVSASGIGDQSVLPSLDSVSKQLRGKLGEALSMVSKQSMPLAKVATPDLNALRAYSLGERAYDRTDLAGAEAYFREALSVDPHFALAHVMLAKIYRGENRPADAVREITAAQSDGGRLSARDDLYVNAYAAQFSAPRLSLQKWKLLTSVYPDYFPAVGEYAFNLWQFSNAFTEAIPYAKQSASPKNPHRATGEYLLGALYVEADDYADALNAFSDAVAEGARFQNAYYASAYAAQRRFNEATSILARGKASGIGSFDVGVTDFRVAMAVDQGEWRDVGGLLNAAKVETASMGAGLAGRFDAMALSLATVDGTPPAARASPLRVYIAQQSKAYAAAASFDRPELRFHIVLAAFLAARANDVALANRALAIVGPHSVADSPALDNLRAVAQAEIACADGRPSDAITLLKPWLNGNELYITHVVLMRAYGNAHADTQALAEAHWLSTHRGRAYSESNLLVPFNVANSDLALLKGAEIASGNGNNGEAQRMLSAFLKGWPTAVKMPWLATRISTLQRRI